MLTRTLSCSGIIRNKLIEHLKQGELVINNIIELDGIGIDYLELKITEL